jgi:hypothetical protein
MFICHLCKKEFKSKQNLDVHFNRKFKCNIITPHKCNECNKYFKYNKNLLEHIIKQNCKNKVDINKYEKQKNSNKDELKIIFKSNLCNNKKIELINSLTNINNIKISIILEMNISTNEKIKLLNKLNYINDHKMNQNENKINNYNNINNIQLNNFGKEDISYLDNEYFRKIIMEQHIEKGYVQLIKDIYLNKEHPENNTIKIENLNNKYAHIYNEGNWNTILKYDLRQQIHLKNYTILKMHYNKLKGSMSYPKKEETRVFLARDDTDDPHMMYVIDKIILLFYNESIDDDKYKINKNII